MNTQPDLFDPPAQRHSRTSVAAACAAARPAQSQRARVLAYLERQGLKGATDEELQVALALNPSTQRPRRIELVKAGRVIDSGKERRTCSGRRAVVWTVSPSHG